MPSGELAAFVSLWAMAKKSPAPKPTTCQVRVAGIDRPTQLIPSADEADPPELKAMATNVLLPKAAPCQLFDGADRDIQLTPSVDEAAWVPEFVNATKVPLPNAAAFQPVLAGRLRCVQVVPLFLQTAFADPPPEASPSCQKFPQVCAQLMPAMAIRQMLNQRITKLNEAAAQMD